MKWNQVVEEAVEVCQAVLTNMKMSAKMFMGRVKTIIALSKNDKKATKGLVKFVIKQIQPDVSNSPIAPVVPIQTKSELEINKEEIRNMIPLLKRIYIDEATRDLFPVVMKEGATIIMTPDFIEFLEKVSSEKSVVE